MFCILFIIPLLHVLGYGFCFFIFYLAKFQISSFIRGSFYSFVQLRSYHIFWENLCRTRFFLFVKRSHALSGSLSIRFAPESANEKESERACAAPETLLRWSKGICGEKFRCQTTELRFCLFVCLFSYSYRLVYPERGGKMRE